MAGEGDQDINQPCRSRKISVHIEEDRFVGHASDTYLYIFIFVYIFMYIFIYVSLYTFICITVCICIWILFMSMRCPLKLTYVFLGAFPTSGNEWGEQGRVGGSVSCEQAPGKDRRALCCCSSRKQ